MRRVLRYIFAVGSVLVFGGAVYLAARSARVSDFLPFRFAQAPDELNEQWMAIATAPGVVQYTFHERSRHDETTRRHYESPPDTQCFNFVSTDVREFPPGTGWIELAGFGVLANSDSQPVGYASDATTNRTNWRDVTRSFGVRFPIWSVMLLSGLLTGYLISAIRRDRRLRLNPTLCRTCGYDLRAGHDKCPECGGESHVKPVAATA